MSSNMKEEVGDLWEYHPDTYVVIPTNGVVKNTGRAVMGAGLAKQAKKRFPDLDKELGEKITEHGNHVYAFQDKSIVTFPTKNDYRDDASIELIKSQLPRLARFADHNNLDKNAVAVPRLGCGLGNLSWRKVKPLLKDKLDSRFILVSYSKNIKR